MEFGWRIVLGSLIGIFGAASGSVGGVGGGGIFLPMLALIIGFDPKSSAAMSKCMIMGTCVSTVYYNLKLRHPSLDIPLIDYDLAMLIQPMLMLGVSIGVIFNVVFPDWLVTALLIILFLATSMKAFLKGVETWKKETIKKRVAAQRLEQMCQEPEHATAIPTGPGDSVGAKNPSAEKSSLLKNVYWKEFSLLAFVWLAFLALQIANKYSVHCSTLYWVLNSLQIPVAVGVTMYEAHGLMTGKKVLSSKGSQQNVEKPRQLFVYCLSGIVAGLVGGLLGAGGGFIIGPLFLELGIPPQVSSATATFAMMFSSSMSVVEFYILHRFPVPYAAYFIAVAFMAAIIGQHYVSKLIRWLGRASLIIFILASMIFISAISLGGVGISNIIHKIESNQYMGFESICNKFNARDTPTEIGLRAKAIVTSACGQLPLQLSRAAELLVVGPMTV
ncbi:sulfite exporter TauE/SafE family protein 3-like [Panicum virgatum]|uniref:sulfite exporter TauE/SafE family protein 3-like n=1 Tax=Panicum virgatum TaxID=38727 RepID=UPI0019D4EF3F|nr:sulfite exporter TauE/SafE family protein 3-like [Panicum virgatum]